MRKRIRDSAAAFLVALFAQHPWACAADAPAYGPAPDWVTPQEVPPAPYGDSTAPLRVLLSDAQVNLASTVSEMYADEVLLIQSPQGLTAAGTVSVVWRPETDLVTIHTLRILRDGNAINLLDAGHTFTILRREDQLEYAALSGVLTAVIQPEGLRVGDRIEFAYTLKRTDSLLGGIPEQIIGVTPESHPVRVHLSARWPANDKMNWRASPFIEPTTEQHVGPFIELSTTRNNDEPLVQPQGAPARFGLDRALQVSGQKSWPAISALMYPLFDHASQLSRTSPLQAELDRIRAASPDTKTRAEAVLRLVQDQIRYVYLGMNDARLVPADVETTWVRRYGDCKAKTALLLAMLHGLGIDSEAVAVTTLAGDALPSRVPMIQWFNHVLVRATIAGKTYWLDGTRTGDRLLDDLVVPNFGWGLPLRSTGADLMKLVPSSLSVPTEESVITVDASAGATAPASFTAQVVLRGDSATVVQNTLSRLTDKQRDTALRAYWTQQSYWADNWDHVNIEDAKAVFDDVTGFVHLSVAGNGTMNWQGDQHLLSSLAMGEVVDLKREPGPNHDAPYLVAFPIYRSVIERIKLPNGGAGFETVGSNIDRTIAGTHYTRSALIKDGELIAQVTQRSMQPEFPASEAANAQTALREMWDQPLYAKLPSSPPLVLTAPEPPVESPLSKAKAACVKALANLTQDTSEVTGLHKPSLRLLRITPAAGADVQQDTLLLATLAYSMEDSSPTRFTIFAQFDTDKEYTTGGSFDDYPELNGLSGKVTLCYPLAAVWDDSTIKRPFKVRFYITRGSGHGGTVLAHSDALVYPTTGASSAVLLKPDVGDTAK